MRKKHILSTLVRCVTYAAAIFTAGCSLFLLFYILVRGIPNMKLSLFSWKYTTDNLSMMPAIINTVLLTLSTLLLSVPLGVGAAIYLTEYAKRGSRLVRIIRLTSETLSGIPSILFGLFGYLMFNVGLHFSYSFLSGVITMAAMVLPLILRTTEESLAAVPDLYREGSYGLGAGGVRTVFSVVLPPALPGILSGVILAVGRIVGESAALIFTAGTGSKVFSGLFSSGRSLAVHMYCLLSEGLYTDQAYATAVVLISMVVLINFLAGAAARRLAKRSQA